MPQQGMRNWMGVSRVTTFVANRPRLVVMVVVMLVLLAVQGTVGAEALDADPDGTVNTNTGPNSDE